MQFSIIYFRKVDSQLNKRLDAEYWHPAVIKLVKKIRNSTALGNLIRDGYRVVYESTEILGVGESERNGRPTFLQAADVDPPMINVGSAGFVANKDWERYPKGRVKKGEIILEVKGNVKKAAIVPDKFPEKVLVSGTLYKFTPKDTINKYFLVVYLTCKYGQILKDRLISNIGTPFISKNELYEIPVPVLSKQFQSKIQDYYLNAFECGRK